MNGGFFTAKEIQSESRPDGKTYSCASCGIIKDAITARMKPFGNFKKKILNIGGIPSESDDERGKPWHDTTGRFLKKSYESLGIDLFDDCLNINAVNCHTKQSIGSYQVACCRKSVLKVIKEYKPDIIVLFGDLALESIIGSRWKSDMGTLDKWRGWAIPDQDLRAFICPMYHPGRVADANKEVQTIWKRDLSKVRDLLKEPFPIYKEPTIIQLNDLQPLKKITSGSIAFDYETTGLKPHAPGHRIVCASVAVSEDLVYSFMMPETKSEREPFVELLKNPNIYKIAQNLKFEHTWSLVRLRTTVVNWLWDTMLASHLFDNRTGVTGLKFQAYVQFGIVDYSSDIRPYLEAKDNKNGNALNNIEELIKTKEGRNKLLHYCALDSVYEYRLAKWQRGVLNEGIDDIPF